MKKKTENKEKKSTTKKIKRQKRKLIGQNEKGEGRNAMKTETKKCNVLGEKRLKMTLIAIWLYMLHSRIGGRET